MPESPARTQPKQGKLAIKLEGFLTRTVSDVAGKKKETGQADWPLPDPLNCYFAFFAVNSTGSFPAYAMTTLNLGENLRTGTGFLPVDIFHSFGETLAQFGPTP